MANPLQELATALVWLTRLPVLGWLPRELPSLGRVAWAFPVVGLIAGLVAALPLVAGLWAGMPAPVAAILAIGTGILVTGGLHEDGLADFTDSAGGTTRERRLEIMRDSRIGSYGVLALIVVTGLRIAALTALAGQGAWLAAAALIGAGAASRAGMALGLGLMPPARPDGLGRQAGRPGARGMAVALTLGVLALVLPAVFSAQPIAFWAISALAIAAAQAWLARRAMRGLGGQTGDVLGALQQVGEAACMTAMTILI